MSLSANIPHSALVARRSAMNAEQTAEVALERLATGSKIHRAADDAAGLAIAQRHNANLLGLTGAVRNSANAQSLLALADHALAGVADGLIRINELATAAQNPAVSSHELKMIQQEIDHLIAEIDQTASRVTFNQTSLLNGAFKNQTALVGARAGDSITFSLPEVSASSLGAYVFYADGVAASAAAAGAANNPVTTAEDISIRGSIGSYTFNAIDQESAQNLAARVSARRELTGVDASAKTEALLASGSANEESIRLLINDVATQRFDFSSTNMVAAVDAINALTEVTGVTAQSAVGGIRLTQAEGQDVTIENMESSVNLSVRKIAADG